MHRSKLRAVVSWRTLLQYCFVAVNGGHFVPNVCEKSYSEFAKLMFGTP